MNRKDVHGKTLQDGDIIDIHQTVNGCSIFVVLTVNPLDIRYGWDQNRRYEYDQEELLTPCKYSGVADFEIKGKL